MASVSFTQRGGTEAEYRVHRALYSTGRKEPVDFMFRPPQAPRLSFLVFSPFVGITVGNPSSGAPLLDVSSVPTPRIEYISPESALADGRAALSVALGG